MKNNSTSDLFNFPIVTLGKIYGLEKSPFNFCHTRTHIYMWGVTYCTAYCIMQTPTTLAHAISANHVGHMPCLERCPKRQVLTLKGERLVWSDRERFSTNVMLKRKSCPRKVILAMLAGFYL